MDDFSRDELLGATPWTDPRERGLNVPPPLRVRQRERPPREAHFDRTGTGAVLVTLHQWYAIHDQFTRRTGNAAGWYSRASTFTLPALLAAAAFGAWKELPDLVVVGAETKPEPPHEVQGALPGIAGEQA